MFNTCSWDFVARCRISYSTPVPRIFVGRRNAVSKRTGYNIENAPIWHICVALSPQTSLYLSKDWGCITSRITTFASVLAQIRSNIQWLSHIAPDSATYPFPQRLLMSGLVVLQHTSFSNVLVKFPRQSSHSHTCSSANFRISLYSITDSTHQLPRNITNSQQ